MEGEEIRTTNIDNSSRAHLVPQAAFGIDGEHAPPRQVSGEQDHATCIGPRGGHQGQAPVAVKNSGHRKDDKEEADGG